MKTIMFFLISSVLTINSLCAGDKPLRLLVVTGGHNYNKETFNELLSSLGKNISYNIVTLPDAYEMFLPVNRDKYDVLVFYHMFQVIDDSQKKNMAECIAGGKPLIVLHHSICAYDNWEEYFRIVGGKYFHKQTSFEGKDYMPSSYIHDLKFKVKIADKNHPVTKGISDFEIFDETYNNYYVSHQVHPLLLTDEPTSTPVIGWAHQYGKARVVTLQSGHDTPTFKLEHYRQLLRQSINWVCEN